LLRQHLVKNQPSPGAAAMRRIRVAFMGDEVDCE
jgi:hypothetical protein